MPTCRFYLEGLCSKDDCPYLHVKINPKADICKDFVEGFCKKGAEVSQSNMRFYLQALINKLIVTTYRALFEYTPQNWEKCFNMALLFKNFFLLFFFCRFSYIRRSFKFFTSSCTKLETFALTPSLFYFMALCYLSKFHLCAVSTRF